jgi:hypothetical protein
MVQVEGWWFLVSMLKHCYSSIATLLSAVGGIRTHARTDLRRAWLRHIDHLQIRNARAHIRIFPSADFQDQR